MRTSIIFAILLVALVRSQTKYNNVNTPGSCPTWCKLCVDTKDSSTKTCTTCWDDTPVEKLGNETYCNNFYCDDSYCSHCDFTSKRCYKCQGSYMLNQTDQCVKDCIKKDQQIWNAKIDGWKCFDKDFETKKEVVKDENAAVLKSKGFETMMWIFIGLAVVLLLAITYLTCKFYGKNNNNYEESYLQTMSQGSLVM